MKKYLIIVCIVIAVTSCSNESANKSQETTTDVSGGIATSTFKVWGNCDMCKETIEGALKTEGVDKAEWNTESKIITVSYNPDKIKLEQIQKNIASAGYDNEGFKGDDKAYNELPECCQYEQTIMYRI